MSINENRVGVSANTLFLWHNNENKWELNGTPIDVVRKLDMIGEHGLLDYGAEIILFPCHLVGSSRIPTSIANEFASLPIRSVHIADKDPLFLLRSKGIKEELRELARTLEQLNAEHIVLHADSLRYNRTEINKLLANFLPKVKLLVENTDPKSGWGHKPQDLLDIYKDIPDAGLCLDICHIKDFPGMKLSHFISEPELLARIGEIHFSYSGHNFQEDLYEVKGYPGYAPFHLLWSAIEEKPSTSTIDLIAPYPKIIEGLLPREDMTMKLLHQEIDIALGR